MRFGISVLILGRIAAIVLPIFRPPTGADGQMVRSRSSSFRRESVCGDGEFLEQAEKDANTESCGCEPQEHRDAGRTELETDGSE
jgi:hypothetical protein